MNRFTLSLKYLDKLSDFKIYMLSVKRIIFKLSYSVKKGCNIITLLFISNFKKNALNFLKRNSEGMLLFPQK